MSRAAGVLLQTVLAVGLLVLLLVQVLVLPAYAADSAQRFPEAAFLEVPVLVLVVAVVACVQVAVVCVMALLSLVGQERIFDPAAYRYVDVFIGATAAASVLVLGTGVLVSATAGSPAALTGAVVAVGGAGVTLLMVVMRALLRQATAQRAALGEVARAGRRRPRRDDGPPHDATGTR